MRFSETLRFNANPDWWIYYIPYDELKHQIAKLQHIHNLRFLTTHPPSDAEHRNPHHDDQSSDEEAQHETPSRDATVTPVSTLRRTASQRVLFKARSGYGAVLAGLQSFPSEDSYTPSDAPPSVLKDNFEHHEAQFFEKLERTAQQIDEFFESLSQELSTVTSEIRTDAVAMSEKLGISAANRDHVEGTPLLRNSDVTREEFPASVPNEAEMEAFRRRMLEHYKELGETVNYSTLNRTGFDKILKKHDKCTGRSTRAGYMARLAETFAFTDTTNLEILQQQTEDIYSKLFKAGDHRAGKEELREGLRDLIIWGRNTIWRDVLRTERRVSAFHAMKGGENVDISKAANEVVFRPRFAPCFAAGLVFLIISLFPQLVENLPVQGGEEYSEATLAAAHRCLAMSAFVIILWAWEGIPLYVTSFLVFPASILLKVFVGDDGEPLGAHAASKTVFEHMSSPTLILIICVYAMGAALSKFELDKLLATWILSRMRRADRLLLAVMFLAVFVSMFISNVAAPVLLNSVMMPTIDAMRGSSTNRKYVQCLLLGIMVSSNIGGMASPISSPQSAVALGLLTGEHSISFFKWLVIALPQCGAMVLAFYVILYFIYRPQQYSLPPLPRCSEKLKWPHWLVIGTVSMTVLFWSDHSLSDVFGSAGVVAVIPLLVFFGAGILNKEDFNNLPWDVVYLVAGGIVLGAAVESCKLLDLVAQRLTSAIGESNVRLTYYIFCVFMATVANAVSHTVSAIIVLPLIFKIGVDLGHPQLLVLGGTFAASSAMALPVSSFPNISAVQVEDETGEPYLSPTDILRIGSIMTLVATVVLLTIGYELMVGLKL